MREHQPTGATQTDPDFALRWERDQVQELASDEVEASILTLVSKLSTATFDLLVL